MKLLIILISLIGVAFASPRFAKEIDGEDLPLKLERHKRMFFIAGTENTKLQASLKFPLIYKTNLFFAYTETGFWRLFQESSNPIVDLNHNPELFYRWRLKDDQILDLGAEHMSNGRDENNSRSWNTLYAQPSLKLGSDTYLTTKLYYLWDVEAEDLYRYMGFVDFELGYKKLIWSKFQSNEAYIRWRPGGNMAFDSNRYDTFEIGLKFKFTNWETFGHMFINYYNGYVESQLTYKQYTRALRVGLIF